MILFKKFNLLINLKKDDTSMYWRLKVELGKAAGKVLQTHLGMQNKHPI